MRSRLAIVVIVLGVIATGAFRVLVSAPSVEAQGVTPQLLARYLERSGLAWKRDDKDQNVFKVNKTSGLKKALGYTAFKAVLDEHLRIADVAMVELYQKYR